MRNGTPHHWPPVYLPLTWEQIEAVAKLVKDERVQELVLASIDEGVVHVRGYGYADIRFTASVDSEGQVHDFLTYGAVP